MSAKKIEKLETPDFTLASDERRSLESAEGPDLYQLLKLWHHEMIRCSDPQGRHDPNVALSATKFKMGIYPTEAKAELVDLVLAGEYPKNFLADVRSLMENWPEVSREAAYLNSLKVFYLTERRWPSITELDRQASEDHPEVFPQLEDGPFGPDERRMFRRLRKKLGIDWLPEGQNGRPKK